ncbi:hypothetical protein [Paenibacillus sp. WLX2291]|uniref:hypothetical protein n=1 Tax=Paenibacillus sp. WLX2291 TaxID=3296934 RepID=UPI003983FCCC
MFRRKGWVLGLWKIWVVVGIMGWVGMWGCGLVEAGGVPDDVRVKVEQELRDSQTQVHILGQDGTVQGQEHVSVREDTYTLGEGYPYYSLNGIAVEKLGGQADKREISANQVLDLAGYVFTTQYHGQDQSLIYTSTPPKYDAITTVATSEGFSEDDFTRPLQHAIAWSGNDGDGKLIDDMRTGIKAWVADVDGQEQVMLIQNNMLLEMKQFDTLTLEEFVHRLWSAEKSRADWQDAPGNGWNHDASEMSGAVGASVHVDDTENYNADDTNDGMVWIWGGVALGVVVVGIAGWLVARKIRMKRRQQ